MHPCTEFGVASSKFTFTGGPHVKTASSPLARAAGTPLERHPQWILSRHSMNVTCEFGISGASRLTCRCVRIFKCPNHLRVHCTCTMHPSPLKHTAPSRPCQGAPTYRVWCHHLCVITIIFPRSKHIDQCLSLLRSDQPFGHYSRKTKNKDCANRNRHVPSATDRLSTGTVIFPMSKHIDYCLSLWRVCHSRVASVKDTVHSCSGLLTCQNRIYHMRTNNYKRS